MFDGRFGESVKSGGEIDKGGGLNVFDNRFERGVFFVFSVVLDKEFFVGGDFVRDDIGVSRGDEILWDVSMVLGSIVIFVYFGVNELEFFFGFIFS